MAIETNTSHPQEKKGGGDGFLQQLLYNFVQQVLVNNTYNK